jgi:hypothetical protein
MKSFLLACVAAIVIAVIGWFALNQVQDSSAEAYSTQSVRLGA